MLFARGHHPIRGRVDLRHQQFPKLAAISIIDYNSRAQTIRFLGTIAIRSETTDGFRNATRSEKARLVSAHATRAVSIRRLTGQDEWIRGLLTASVSGVGRRADAPSCHADPTYSVSRQLYWYSWNRDAEPFGRSHQEDRQRARMPLYSRSIRPSLVADSERENLRIVSRVDRSITNIHL